MEKLNSPIPLWRPLLGLTLLFILTGVGWIVSSHITFEHIRAWQTILKNFVAKHYNTSLIAFVLAYASSMALSLGIAALLTLTGGYLFGLIPGFIASVTGATLGAAGAFILVRVLIGRFIQQRYQKELAWFNKEFQEHGMLFLLAARLIAIIPFGLVTTLAALTQVPFITFTLTTFFGIMPATLLYTYAGTHLSELHSLTGLLSPHFLIAGILLAILALIPVLLRRIKAL